VSLLVKIFRGKTTATKEAGNKLQLKTSGSSALIASAFLLPGVVLLAYGWSLFNSPAFGSLADQSYHLALAQEYAEAAQAGEFPPRWAAGLNGGRGAPTFVVYPPLFSMLTAGLNSLTDSPRNALRAAVLVTALGGFWAVFYLARSNLSVTRSLIAGALALLLPGPTMLALGRGMYPNFAALVWVALAAGATQRLVLGRSVRANQAVLVIALSGLLLTHALTAFMTGILLVATLPFLLFRIERRVLLRCCEAVLLAMFITAWYWIPLLEAGSYLRLEYLTRSHPYLESTLWGAAPDATAYEENWTVLNLVGKGMVIAQSILSLFVFFALKDAALAGTGAPSAAKLDSSPRPPWVFLDLLPWIAGFALLAAIDPAARLLVELPRFSMVQFSWRWQLFVSLWCAVGLASLPRRPLSFVAAALGAIVLLFFSPLLSSVDRLPASSTALSAEISKDDLDALDPSIRAAYGANAIELRPIGSDSAYYLPAPYGQVSVLAGQAAVNATTLQPGRRLYTVEAASPSTLRFVTYHCPGWRALLDDAEHPITAEPETGLQLIDVPAGTHRLELSYEVRWGW